jgi:hypothetical protein
MTLERLPSRRMRVDTKVVESNIHYPTDSTSLGDGVRVLIRTMQRVFELIGAVGTRLRDRSRSIAQRVREIARAARSRAPPSQEKMKQAYDKLLKATGRVVGQAKRFSQEINNGVKRCTDVVEQVALEGQRQILGEMVPPVQQVMRQTVASRPANSTAQFQIRQARYHPDGRRAAGESDSRCPGVSTTEVTANLSLPSSDRRPSAKSL